MTRDSSRFGRHEDGGEPILQPSSTLTWSPICRIDPIMATPPSFFHAARIGLSIQVTSLSQVSRRVSIRLFQEAVTRRQRLDLRPARRTAVARDRRRRDPRVHLLEVDRMRFVGGPRGAFWMGEEGVADAPLHRNGTLNRACWIAETPVTVAQFAEFVAATVCPGHDPAASNSLQNRPAVLLSWPDTRAFCAWLSERWRSVLPANRPVSLPSEAEWEKAARAGEQIPTSVRYATIADGFPVSEAVLHDNPLPRRFYPGDDDWDADQANAEESIGETSTPGCCAAGHSPHGCEDLAGNVWEWTRSLWGTDWRKPDFVYPTMPPTGNLKIWTHRHARNDGELGAWWQLLGQRGLARVRVRNDGKRSSAPSRLCD